EFHSGSLIPAARRIEMGRIAAQHGIVGFRGRSYVDLVEAAYQRFGAMPQGGAEAMARFGAQLEPFLAELPDVARRGVRYSIADAVMGLESFGASDFVAQATHTLTDVPVGTIHPDDYLAYVRGFVENGAPYTTHPFSQGQGVLNITRMRDIASHNMWPLELQPHDFKHVHYALSHPRALGVYFKS